MVTRLIVGSHPSLLRVKVKTLELQRELCESAYSANSHAEDSVYNENVYIYYLFILGKNEFKIFQK